MTSEKLKQMQQIGMGCLERKTCTWRHGSRLSTDGPGGPDVSQCSAKDRGEIIAVSRLVSASRQALLLQALQRRVVSDNRAGRQGALLTHLAMFGAVNDRAIFR